MNTQDPAPRVSAALLRKPGLQEPQGSLSDLVLDYFC